MTIRCVAVLSIVIGMASGCTTIIPPTEPSAKVEMTADKQTVKGINNWEGEIIGKPTQESKFRNLKIGMSMKQVIDLIGQPTDQNAYTTSKTTLIPFYYGSDRYRHELLYKGQGRLVFAGGVVGSSSGYLVTIIYDTN